MSRNQAFLEQGNHWKSEQNVENHRKLSEIAGNHWNAYKTQKPNANNRKAWNSREMIEIVIIKETS